MSNAKGNEVVEAFGGLVLALAPIMRKASVRWPLRIMIALTLLMVGNPILIAIVVPSWFAWRVFKTYEGLRTRAAKKRAQRATQALAVKRERRKFRMMIELG
jgi:hypothetical protein